MRPLEDDSCLDLRLLRKSGTEEGKIKRKKKKDLMYIMFLLAFSFPH